MGIEERTGTRRIPSCPTFKLSNVRREAPCSAPSLTTVRVIDPRLPPFLLPFGSSKGRILGSRNRNTVGGVGTARLSHAYLPHPSPLCPRLEPPWPIPHVPLTPSHSPPFSPFPPPSLSLWPPLLSYRGGRETSSRSFPFRYCG